MPGKTKHGMFGTPIYKIWGEMIQRCTNPNNQHWDRYGGRGIKVCQEWRDFSAFYADMGQPDKGLSLDRIDNDGDYCPTNCRWATKAEQEINKPKKPGCSSQHKGVYWFAARNRWLAAIQIDGKQKHIGYFDREEDAIAARQAAELARREADK